MFCDLKTLITSKHDKQSLDCRCGLPLQKMDDALQHVATSRLGLEIQRQERAWPGEVEQPRLPSDYPITDTDENQNLLQALLHWRDDAISQFDKAIKSFGGGSLLVVPPASSPAVEEAITSSQPPMVSMSSSGRPDGHNNDPHQAIACHTKIMQTE